MPPAGRAQAGKQQLLETEELGTDIMRQLHTQRETIIHARDTLHGADDNITKSRKVLSSMARRFFQNKLIMYGIILMLLAAICLIMYASRPARATRGPARPARGR